MTIQFNAIFIIKILVMCIMIFSLGLKIDVSYRTRQKANVIWLISVAVLWILNMIFPTR